MKSFDRILMGMAALAVLIFAGANFFLFHIKSPEKNREWRVEINRIAFQIEKEGMGQLDLTACEYVTGVEKYGGAHFWDTDSDYAVREIDGVLYRFDYTASARKNRTVILMVNIILAGMSAAVAAVMIYIRTKIILPFDRLKGIPYELAKGNLTAPLPADKNRFFGKLVWGLDLLREKMEQQKERELARQREKKMLLLSLSHDIKTPLSAIKLYAKALSKGLYTDTDRLLDAAENINARADEIEGFVSRIIRASREDFLSLDVKDGEFYLSELVKETVGYYSEKLALIRTDFCVGEYTDCLLKGDLERSVEVLQNIMENAVKYGDGRRVELGFDEEDGCVSIAVKSSGGNLSDAELAHIFDSFFRGTNAKNTGGSGLGLYICRQLMHKMGGEIFAGCSGESVSVVAVFGKV